MDFKKILLSLTVLVLTLGMVTGCTESDEKKTETTTEQSKGKCKVLDCIKQIEVTNTVEEINEIIGFEGETSEQSKNVKWKLNSKDSIALTYAGDSPILQANYDKSTIMNEKNNFGVFNEIKEMLNKGKTITYKEMVEKLGGVEGTLEGKTSSSVAYAWVDKHNRTFRATFKTNKKGACSIISLR